MRQVRNKNTKSSENKLKVMETCDLNDRFQYCSSEKKPLRTQGKIGSLMTEK